MQQNIEKRENAVIVAGRELVDAKTASIAPELFPRLKYAPNWECFK